MFAVADAATAAWELNMPVGVTEISRTVFDLHMLILWICVIIGVVVFGAIIYSVVYHRKSKGAVAAEFHESTTVEMVWTVVPFIILVGMAVPAAKTLVVMEQTGNSDITLKVTAYQWKWQYEYLDEGISFFSTLSTPREQIFEDGEKGENYLLEVDNPLVLPVGKKVRMLLTANDVIHAWWVPDFAVKKDAIPGFINEMWTRIDEPGVYRGQCAELCGRDHGFMPIVVEAKSEADYQAWVANMRGSAETVAADAADAGKEWSMAELMQSGEKVYTKNCVACHQPNGKGLPPAFPPIAGSPIATGPVDAHLNLVLNGKAGTAMVPFGPQLDDAEVAAVLTYQRNSFGNQVGDAIQPADVAAARN
jgi:cytochrome c oxidase subunit 2